MSATLKYFFIFFSLFSLSAFAQENPLEKNEQDKIYTPDKNSIFFHGGNNSSDRTIDESEIHNAIKFNPGLLVRSTAAIFYERNITNGITFSGGLGSCYNLDRVMALGVTAEFNLSDPQSTLPLATILTPGYAQYVKGGNIFMAASFRFYYENYYTSYESFNSGYFEIGLRYYTNHMNVDDNTSSYYTNNYNYGLTTGGVVAIRNAVYQISYGYELYTSGKVKTTHDFYIGVGIRNTSYNLFTQEERYLVNQYSQAQLVPISVMSSQRESALMPAFVFGYVFGFGW